MKRLIGRTSDPRDRRVMRKGFHWAGDRNGVPKPRVDVLDVGIYAGRNDWRCKRKEVAYCTYTKQPIGSFVRLIRFNAELLPETYWRGTEIPGGDKAMAGGGGGGGRQGEEGK